MICDVSYDVMCVLAQSISQVLVVLVVEPVQSLRAQSSVSVSHDEAVAVITSLLPPLSPLTSHHDSKLSGGSCGSPPSPPGPGRPRPRSVYDLNYNINIILQIIL